MIMTRNSEFWLTIPSSATRRKEGKVPQVKPVDQCPSRCRRVHTLSQAALNMGVLMKSLFLLLALHNAVFVRSQTDVQTFLDAFCRVNRDNNGCTSKPLVTEGGAGGPIPGVGQGNNVACLPGAKRCTQLPNLCVPSDIPCSAIGSGRSCELPKAINTKQRVLVCGDGSKPGTVYVKLGCFHMQRISVLLWTAGGRGCGSCSATTNPHVASPSSPTTQQSPPHTA
ncbi:uncharacterized protein LOC134781197 [Penaeus indicus]|uniref:uncharacterized protein LOC134781197 n=1 Tax=Penaeus indicus TaxID=29960 RepID=UPI00300D562F